MPQPIRVAAVGVSAAHEGSILSALPAGGLFEVIACCDEGMPPQGDGDGSVRLYPDYNVLLQDSPAELVLVGGPVEKRRDFAVRALNAGRHVVLDLPFCEEAADAERVLKTALQRGLIATADLHWRNDPDLLAVRAALAAETPGGVQGVLCSAACPQPPGGSPSQPGLLRQVGLPLLDQVHLLLDQDVKSVSAHLHRPIPGAGETSFLVYLPLRKGGWAIAQAASGPTGLPRWAVYGRRAVITAAGGQATVTEGEQQRVYEAAPPSETFWSNLHRAVRHDGELLYHPAGIVRAMKLLEAAFESAELGEPVAI